MFSFSISSVMRSANNCAFFLSVLLLSLPFVSNSAPVRSNLGGDGIERGETVSYTAADYVQDGLIAMWDAIENVGWGRHDSYTLVWRDLVGTHDLHSTGKITSWGTDKSIIHGNASYTGWIGQNFEVGGQLCYDVCLGDFGNGGYVFGAPFSSGVRPSVTHSLIIWGSGPSYISNPRLPSNTNIAVNFRDGVYLDSEKVAAIRGPASGVTSRPFGIGYYYTSMTVDMEVRCFRLYNRTLTPEEIRYNYLIDKARFGL